MNNVRDIVCTACKDFQMALDHLNSIRKHIENSEFGAAAEEMRLVADAMDSANLKIENATRKMVEEDV